MYWLVKTNNNNVLIKDLDTDKLCLVKSDGLVVPYGKLTCYPHAVILSKKLPGVKVRGDFERAKIKAMQLIKSTNKNEKSK